MNRHLRFLLLQSSLVLGAVVMIALADVLIGMSRPELKLAHHLFPPNANISVTTSEFAYTAHINGMGMRDHAVPSEENKGLRVAVVGDSFTYGWGVSLEQAWIKRLEHGLRGKGVDVHFFNLGKPGAGPAEYARIVEVALPQLRPDVVLMVAQQTDDLQQSLPNAVYAGLLAGLSSRDLYTRLRGRIQRTFPNISLLFSANVSPTLNWGHTVGKILELVSAEERAIFEGLDEEVQNRFLAGDLNPGLLVLALKTPDYFTSLREPASARQHIAAMQAHVERIRRASEAVGSRLVILSLPNRAYVSVRDMHSLQRLGFEVTDDLPGATWPDGALAEVAGDIRLITVSEDFAAACQAVNCYFEYDDHFSSEGHRIYAGLLETDLEKILKMVRPLHGSRPVPGSRADGVEGDAPGAGTPGPADV
jgi:hypothetical protein